MGAYLSEPVTETFSTDEHSELFSYGASSMQGWRNSQEDAHNSILNFDKDSSFFAVYDGHGGAEVAKYCSANFPNFLKEVSAYKSGNISQGLEDSFLDFDMHLTTPEVKKQLKLLADDGNGSSSEEDDIEVKKLYAEASMPIKDLMAKYSGALENNSTASPMLKAKSCQNNSESVLNVENGSSSSATDNSPGECIEENKVKSAEIDIAVKKDTCENKNEISADKTPHENGIVSHHKLSGDTDTVDGPEASNSDVQLPGNSADSEPCSSSSRVSKTNAIKGKNVKARELRPKESMLLLDSSDDDSDVSDEEYNEAESSEAATSDEDSNDEGVKSQKENIEDDDDDQWEDLEDDDDDDADEEVDENVEQGANAVSVFEVPGMDSGCTAVVALIKGSTLYVANAGDSRCIVCRNSIAVEMSCDHKPEDEIETKRIEAAGGQVTIEGRVNGGLNLSRAIGDHRYKQNESLSAKEQMISAQPDIQTLSIDPKNDEFMVLACDGIWNMMTSQEVVDFVKARLDSNKKLSEICEELFMHCLAPDTSGDGTGCDNMTCIIVTFQPRKITSNSEEPIKASTKRSASEDDQIEPDTKKTKNA